MLELKKISKSFPGVKALADVSVSFAPGEIHRLVGENRAGKSTLMKIITGISQPDVVPASFTTVGQQGVFGIPYTFLIMLLVLSVMSYMYRNALLGRRMLATGGNADAARLSDINNDHMVIGGVVSPYGILMGGVIHTLIRHGLIEMKANPYYMNVYNGALVLLTIAIDRIRKTYGERRK